MFEDQASVLGQPKRNSWPQSSAHRTAQGQSPTVTEPDEPQLSRGSFDQQYAPHGNFSYANQYPGQQFYGTSPHQGHFATPSSHNQNGGYANQSHQLSQSLPQSSALAHFQTQSAPQAMPNNTQVANFFPATKPQPVVPGQASAAPRIDSSLFGADYVSDTTETFYLREQPIRPQPEDGKIRSPAMNGGEFHDAFKCDWHGKENHTLAVTIKDLPSKDAKCSVKSRRVLGIQTHAWAFYKESSTSTSSQLGQVKKISETKANITIENSAAASYTAEGNMTDLTYTIKMGTKIVAAVKRDQAATRASGSRHSYGITVAPHTDCLLMIAIALCIEGLWRTKP